MRPDVTPPPRDDESNNGAERQLFEEFEATSARKTRPRPNHSVAATLLNAARPAASAKNAGDGKIRRPGFLFQDLAKLPRTNIARARDVYDYPVSSPEKDTQTTPFQLSTTVNKKPIRKVKKRKQLQSKGAQKSTAREPQIMPEISVDPEVPGSPVQPNTESTMDPINTVPELSSPPPTLPILESAVPERELSVRTSKRKMKTQPSGGERPKKLPRRDTIDEPTRGLSKPVENKTVALQWRPRKSHPKVVIPVRKSLASTRRPDVEQVPPQSAQKEPVVPGSSASEPPPTETIHTPPRQEQPVRRRGRPPRSRKATLENNETGVVSVSEVNVDGSNHRQHSKEVEDDGASTRQIQTQDNVPETDKENPQAEIDENGASTRQTQPQDNAPVTGKGDSQADYPELSSSDEEKEGPLEAIEQVFGFLDSRRKRRDCLTSEGVKIAQICHAALEAYATPDLSFEDVVRSAHNLQRELESCDADKNSEERRAIKLDAYRRLFPDLVGCLEGTYDWLEEKKGPVKTSISSMKVICLIVRTIINFHRLVASWKDDLKKSVRKKKLLGKVDKDLIVPLRRVDVEFQGILKNLKTEAEKKKIRQQMLRQQELEIHKENEAALYKQKWVRWQDLHLCRLQTEVLSRLRPRLHLDQDLFDTLMKQSKEHDANGQEFQRLPVFKPRTSPPARPISSAIDISWPEEHVAALVDGLQKHAGKKLFALHSMCK